MSSRYEPVKDEIYKQNEKLLAIMCISIILFITSSVLWMVFDSDWLLGICFISLSILILDFSIIFKRRKKGIYLLTDEDYEMMEIDSQKRKKPKRLK